MSKLRTYEQARDWLYSLKNQGTKYGIDRMVRFAEELAHPQRAYPSVHVAGTNGKGSVCSMLDQIFRDQGYRAGLSTSPHLVRQGERIQVGRRILSEEEILAYVRELVPIAQRIASEDPELHPSFFEFMTAMAFLHFKRQGVDFALVEVGLGGRLDATNILSPELSVITSVGLDHCEILGDTLAKIAREKAGIIKPGVPVVLGKLQEEALEVVLQICDERGCKAYKVEDRFGQELSLYPETNLLGPYQRINAGVALLAIETLAERYALDANAARESLRRVCWPGRWDERRLSSGRLIVFDVSHNAEGARWLEQSLEALSARCGDLKPDLVMGIMGGYRAAALVPVAARWANSLTFVEPRQSRSCSFEELAARVPESFAGEVKSARIEALFPGKGLCSLDSDAQRPLVVSGSIYLIGEIWERFYEELPVGQGDLQDF